MYKVNFIISLGKYFITMRRTLKSLHLMIYHLSLKLLPTFKQPYRKPLYGFPVLGRLYR